jgi:hypothetical protein
VAQRIRGWGNDSIDALREASNGRKQIREFKHNARAPGEAREFN